MNTSMDTDIIERVLREDVTGDFPGEFGYVGVVGGSDTYRNTAAIVAIAALRGGCDFVNVVAPEPAADNASKSSLNVMTTSLPGAHVTEAHVKTLVNRREWADCTVVGPGLTQHPETKEAITNFFEADNEGPSVIDADALRFLGENRGFAEPEWVLTPHPGEFRALTGDYPPEDLEERVRIVEQYARTFGCTMVLKGAVDIISDGERTELNDTGNPYMTKGGTGDTLAGLTAALISLRHDPFESACAAAYFNGKAGDRALETYGRGFLLEEMLASVSAVISPELEE